MLRSPLHAGPHAIPPLSLQVKHLVQYRPTIASDLSRRLPREHGTQARRLSSCPRHRSSFLRREELLLPPALDITTGWCKGRFRGFSDLPDARAAACLSHISFDLTHMSSICSWTQEVSPAALQGSVNPPRSGSHLSSTAPVS